ncbi:TRAP-type C4-dicarboxylate transport system permease small subunit [Fusobacterium naviforme]|nr:TRAP transporter small permease [Fusobacterium naviforme]PSL11188.1 TRAP-type C4-dicarboxylate transport system permease small subunit [Fusobacterium naviforme]STO28563.1 2,3-diketo-L-gulonate TRAP transporter small permease protein yiaM [Fusobacterium naviforme]
MLKKFEDMLTKMETVFVCFGLMVLITTVFAAAVLRFFGVDMSISTDLAQLVFAWVSFIGADLAMRKDKHMGVDMLIDKFPLKVQNTIRLFSYILILGFLIFAVRYGIDLCIVNAARKYQTLYISYSYATASCPVGCGLMCISAVKHIVQYIRNIKNNDYSSLAKGEAA